MSANGAIQAANEINAAPLIGIILMAVLIGGWLARLGMNALCQVRLQNIKKLAKPKEQVRSDVWANKLGLKRAPATASIPHGSPFLAGSRERTIYLPDAISDQRDADIILAH